MSSVCHGKNQLFIIHKLVQVIQILGVSMKIRYTCLNPKTKKALLENSRRAFSQRITFSMLLLDIEYYLLL